MKRSIADGKQISPVKLALASLVLGLLAAAGCVNVRVPDIPPIPRIPDIPDGRHGRTTETVVTELGYGTLVIDDGRRILGWWRIDENSGIYELHEPPQTQTGQPNGRERTVETISRRHVIGFQKK